MHFALSDEQQALAEAARAFLGDLPGPLDMAEPGLDYAPGTYARICDEQGWPAILVPEAAGGWGFGVLELAVVLEEVGRALTPSPLFASVALAVSALRTCDIDAAAPHLEAIAGGATATWATRGAFTVRDGRLTGSAHGVVDGHSADLVVVSTDAGWYALPGEALERTRTPGLDPTRPIATVRADGLTVPHGAALGAGDLDLALRTARVLHAAECVGAAQRCLDDAVDYAKVREQFGQPIGRFQALQHLLADVCVDVEAARAATWYAAFALDHQLDDSRLAALTAAAQAGDALFTAAGQSIQAHGGIGFTWEHPAHVFFKRARAARATLGEPAAHRAAFADAVLGPVEA